jgi:hypothetical protein
MGLEDDILPDTKLDRERTTTGKWALGVGLLMFIFVILGFTTPSWMEADPRFYGTKFERLGLWVHCFRSLPDFNDLSHQRFYAGCRWIFNPFTEGYPEIRSYIVPRKWLLIVYSFVLRYRENASFICFERHPVGLNIGKSMCTRWSYQFLISLSCINLLLLL